MICNSDSHGSWLGGLAFVCIIICNVVCTFELSPGLQGSSCGTSHSWPTKIIDTRYMYVLLLYVHVPNELLLLPSFGNRY